MANPASRTELKNYCLRRLGYPVLDINVDEDQMQDRIDDAIEFYRDYHYDGTERVYLKHVITTSDKTNEYITVPATVTAIVGIFDIGDAVNASNLFNIRYQIHLNDLFDFTSTSYTPYVNAMRHVEMLEELFVGKKPIRFNRHTDKLYIDMDWTNDVSTGEFLIIECYRKVDPASYSDIFDDMHLKRYATSLIKRQWGANLSKFSGVAMLGGVTMNGETIYQQAQEEY